MNVINVEKPFVKSHILRHIRKFTHPSIFMNVKNVGSPIPRGHTSRGIRLFTEEKLRTKRIMETFC